MATIIDGKHFLPYKPGDTFGIVHYPTAWGKGKTYYLWNWPQSYDKMPMMGWVKPEQVIVSHFYWDEQYKSFDTPEKYRDFLRRFKDFGVDKTAFVDFSCWYEESDEKTLDTIKRAFGYAEIAVSEGFKLLWDNNLVHRHIDWVLDALPKRVEQYILDANHGEDLTNPIARRNERETFERMVAEKGAKRVIVHTGRKNQAGRAYVYDGRVEVQTVPTSRVNQQHILDKYYK